MTRDRIEERRKAGRIPFVVRVGVAGHRILPDEEWLGIQVKKALGRVREIFPPTAATSISLAAVSSLAEGSDRLVAKMILDEGGALEVCLPLEPEEYRRDFKSEESTDEFDSLLSRASLVLEAPSALTREERYELAGRYIVDRCDILIALWDRDIPKGRGGTATTIRYALEARVPVLLVTTIEGYKPAEDLGDGALSDPFKATGAIRVAAEHRSGEDLPLESTRAVFFRLDKYNAFAIAEDQFDDRVVDELDRRLSESFWKVEGLPVVALAEWAIPFSVRADSLALTFRHLYQRLTSVEFMLAALAVTVVALQELFFTGHPSLAWFEFGLLVALLTIVVLGRRFRLHERWISSRYLVERLRSAFFLAAVGLAERREGGVAGANSGPGEEEWVRRAFWYVWNERPQVEVGESEVRPLSVLLTAGWMDEQIRYHLETSERHRKWRTILTSTTVTLFALTASAAVFHAVGFWPPGSWMAKAVVFLAITLPAFGAALGGIAAQREHQRLSQVHAGMSRSLMAVREKISRAPDLATLQAAAAEAEDIMSEENQDWLGVMRFHDFELHV